MSSCNSNSTAPWRRSQSQICRCTSGSDTRRRSLRGGKSPPGTAPAGLLRAPVELLPDQEAVGQHHTHPAAVEAPPQPPPVLVPATQPLGLLVVLLHPVPPVRVAHQRLQRRPRPEVAPVVLALRPGVPARLLADQPARPALAIGQDPEAAQGHEAPPQPALT